MKLMKNVGKCIDVLESHVNEKINEVPKGMEQDLQMITNIIQRYMSMSEYVRYISTTVVKDEAYKQNVKYCLNNLDQIIKYKLQVSKGKKINNDPRDKAIIDLSDMLVNYSHKSNEKPLIYDVTGNRDSINIKGRYYGKLSVPFDKCFIFTQVPNIVSQVVDFNHDGKGNYSGCLYIFLTGKFVIQYSYSIKRVEDYWHVELNLPIKQKPFGTTCPNIMGLIHQLLNSSNEIYEEYKEVYPNYTIERAMAADIATGMLAVFEMLDSYKSKYIYSVEKDKHIYLYTDKKDITEYIDTHYNGFSYKLLDQWLVNGYWDFLPNKELGRDKEGKPIKGLNWVVPYEKEQKDVVSTNGQQSNLVKVHAIQRAKERYNLDLTIEDLKEVLNMVISGNCKKLTLRDKLGRLKTPKGMGAPYRINYKGATMDVAIDRGRDKSLRVATFLPKPKDAQCTIIDSKDYNTIMTDCSK